jgi:rod shape-determining protein MreC
MAGPGSGGRRRYVLVLLVMTSVTLITLDQRQGDAGPVGALGRFAHRVVAPASDLGSNVLSPVSDWFGGVLHAGSLKHDNARLKRELSAARIDALKGEQARSQNRILMKLDGQAFLDDIPSVVGRVVAQSPGNFQQTVILDRGSESGIKAGMPVVAGDGLVGRVWQAWSGGCNVLLLDDSSFGVGVRMVRGRITGIAQGQAGRSTLTADFSGPLGPLQRPRVHDLAETSGLQGSTFPPGIPVGTVDSVSVSDDGLSVDVRFVPLVDVTSLEYVKVLRWSVGSPVPPALQATTTTTTTAKKSTTTTTTKATTTTTTTTTTTSSGTPTSGP